MATSLASEKATVQDPLIEYAVEIGRAYLLPEALGDNQLSRRCLKNSRQCLPNLVNRSGSGLGSNRLPRSFRVVFRGIPPLVNISMTNFLAGRNDYPEPNLTANGFFTATFRPSTQQVPNKYPTSYPTSCCHVGSGSQTPHTRTAPKGNWSQGPSALYKDIPRACIGERMAGDDNSRQAPQPETKIQND